MIDNLTFLRAIFGDDYHFAHVCSFPDDPNEIPSDRRFICWGGDYFSRTALHPGNQYFTVSTFYPDSSNKARRRKSLFRCTHVIVADDVREKLDVAAVNRLPLPSYKLETSPGSEQWGWILDTPCTDRAKVENLLDGLVAQGLAPEGRDPGMKGVTRYVRLPEGINTKASRVKANGGTAPACRLLEWNPTRRASLDSLAHPFSVNLQAERRDTRVDGATDLPDHPLLDLTDLIYVKEIRSEGRFDITCPWVADHTNQIDDGSAVFTNGDGSIGFKCHHGSCQHRTAKDLLDLIEESHAGFRGKLSEYKVVLDFQKIMGTMPPTVVSAPSPKEDLSNISFLEPQMIAPAPPPPKEDLSNLSFLEPQAVPSDQTAGDPYQSLMSRLRQLPPNTREAVAMAKALIGAVEDLGPGFRDLWHQQIKDYMHWNQKTFDAVLKNERQTRYAESLNDEDLFRRYIYVNGPNMFYDPKLDHMMKPEAFNNHFRHITDDAKNMALSRGGVQKVDTISFDPSQPSLFFDTKGRRAVNTWQGVQTTGAPGNIAPWYDHFEFLGWGGDTRERILDFMAFTLQRPGVKINHAIIFGGAEGIGKDLMIYPLKLALGDHAKTISGRELLADYNGYLMGTKLLVINELDAGNYAESKIIANKVKPLTAAPPETLRVNGKYQMQVEIVNCVNVLSTTNETNPIDVSLQDRRYHMLWSPIRVKGQDGEMSKEYADYFSKMWEWMRDQSGWRFCVHYLMHRDISRYNPYAAPPVTEMMRDVQEASEHPFMSLFQRCTTDRLALFKSDILSPMDIYESFRAMDLPGMGYTVKHVLSLNQIGRLVRGIPSAKALRINTTEGGRRVLYVVRNHDKYQHMRHTDIEEVYRIQIAEARQVKTLRLVKPITVKEMFVDNSKETV